jgi:hypothetical protein
MVTDSCEMYTLPFPMGALLAFMRETSMAPLPAAAMWGGMVAKLLAALNAAPSPA